MTEPHEVLAAVSAAVVDAEARHRALLRSIVSVARAIFGAGASSIFLLDEETHELVFEAVSRPEDEALLGRRFPATEGIAGWVLQSGEPLVINDLTGNATFARQTAASTGYVPDRLMAVPLTSDFTPLGVLEVLDHSPQVISSLDALDLLSLFAEQAAIALEIVRRSRQVRRMVTLTGGSFEELASVAAALDRLDDPQRAASRALLGSLSELLTAAAR